MTPQTRNPDNLELLQNAIESLEHTVNTYYTARFARSYYGCLECAYVARLVGQRMGKTVTAVLNSLLSAAGNGLAIELLESRQSVDLSARW